MADKLRIMVVSSIPPKNSNDPNPQWADLAKITWATQDKYCKQHGYKFDGNVSDIMSPLGTPWVDQVPSARESHIRTMVKFPIMLHYLQPEKCGEIFDYVVWMDADCLVTNYDIPLEKFLNGKGYDPEGMGEMADIIMPWNVDGLHPTVFMVRNTALNLGAIWHNSEAGDRMFRQHGWSDIMSWRFALETPPYRDVVWYHSIRSLCAQHPDIYAMPKRVAKAYEWDKDESLTLHLSALSMPKRIALATEYVERLGLL